MMKEEIHNYVQKLRKQANKTQEDLANTIGVSRQTVIAIEKGNYVPSLLLALKISHFFKKRVEEIFEYHYEK